MVFFFSIRDLFRSLTFTKRKAIIYKKKIYLMKENNIHIKIYITLHTNRILSYNRNEKCICYH